MAVNVVVDPICVGDMGRRLRSRSVCLQEENTTSLLNIDSNIANYLVLVYFYTTFDSKRATAWFGNTKTNST